MLASISFLRPIRVRAVSQRRRDKTSSSRHRIANHYNVECIDLDIHKDWWHPDAKGQDDIARQVLEALALDFNV